MMPKRILHVANFNFFRYGTSFYAMDRKIHNGLVQNGHMALEFSYREISRWENFFRTSRMGKGRMNRRLQDAIDIFQPELLLFGHSETVDLATLDGLRRRFPELRFAMWYVDSYVFPDKERQLRERAARMDWVFTTTGGDVLKKLKTQENRVAFFPNIAEFSMEASRNFERSREALSLDFLYCGRGYSPERTARLAILCSKMGAIRHEVWGCLGRPALTGQAYYEKLSEAACGLNLSHREDIPFYSSDRIAQLTGCGLLTFCPKTPGMDRLFTGEELVYYENDEDLIEKIFFYAREDDLRCQIARKGWERVHGAYNAARVTRFMLEAIWGQPWSSPYEWISEMY